MYASVFPEPVRAMPTKSRPRWAEETCAVLVPEEGNGVLDDKGMGDKREGIVAR